MIDAVDDGEVGVGDWSGNENPLGACREVLGRGLALGEEARALEGDVHAERAPRQLPRIALGRHLDRAGTEVDGVLAGLHRPPEGAMAGVVAQQVGVGRDRTEIVDGNDLEVAAPRFVAGAHHEPADAPEAVDCDPSHHVPLR